MFVHLPAFFIGFMLAPMAKEEKCISFLWMIVVPLFLVIYDEVFAFWVLAWFFGIFICPFTLQIVLLQWKDFYECT